MSTVKITGTTVVVAAGNSATRVQLDVGTSEVVRVSTTGTIHFSFSIANNVAATNSFAILGAGQTEYFKVPNDYYLNVIRSSADGRVTATSVTLK